MRTAIVIATFLTQSLFIALPAGAQSPAPAATTVSGTAQLTAKIVAIDYKTRTVTLQDDKGNMQDVQAGPDVQRFNNLKVGDIVTFTYKEAAAISIVEAGAANAAAPSASSTPTVTRYAGEKPGGEMSQTATTTVTVVGIDPSTPSITVKTQDGRMISFLVQDPKNLNGVKVGDVVQVTYTRALMITVK